MKNQKHNAAGIYGGSAKSDFDSHFSTPWFTVHVLKYYLLKHPKDKEEYISQ